MMYQIVTIIYNDNTKEIKEKDKTIRIFIKKINKILFIIIRDICM